MVIGFIAIFSLIHEFKTVIDCISPFTTLLWSSHSSTSWIASPLYFMFLFALKFHMWDKIYDTCICESVIFCSNYALQFHYFPGDSIVLSSSYWIKLYWVNTAQFSGTKLIPDILNSAMMIINVQESVI